MLAIFILLTELIASVVVLIWAIAILGFTSEANKNTKANFAGKAFGFLAVVFAFMPSMVTIWTGWKYYFSDTWQNVPLGLWLPVIAYVISIPLCLGIVYLYDASFERKE